MFTFRSSLRRKTRPFPLPPLSFPRLPEELTRGFAYAPPTELASLRLGSQPVAHCPDRHSPLLLLTSTRSLSRTF